MKSEQFMFIPLEKSEAISIVKRGKAEEFFEAIQET